jgi:hypothetical protein
MDPFGNTKPFSTICDSIASVFNTVKSLLESKSHNPPLWLRQMSVGKRREDGATNPVFNRVKTG